MRILYFSRTYTVHDRRFLLKMAQSRHEVWYLRLEENGTAYEVGPLPDGIRAVEWPRGLQPADTPELRLQLMPDLESILQQLRPHVVHAGPVQSCGLMIAMADVHPFLLMSRGYDILVDADRDELHRWMTRYALKHSDMLVCDCDAVRARVQTLVPYAEERITQFPWGVDLERFVPGEDSPHLREQLGWEEAFIVLSTRSWEQLYGIDVLLEAFRRAYLENDRFRLVMLGGGSLAHEVQRYVYENGLGDAVSQPGRIPHGKLPDYFRAADLYVSCSRSDGTSVSLLEAMATGLPVVVTDGPGNREWVTAGSNGWLAPSGESEMFAQFMLLAAKMEATERNRISETNRHVAETRADWNTNSDKLMAAFDRLEAQIGN